MIDITTVNFYMFGLISGAYPIYRMTEFFLSKEFIEAVNKKGGKYDVDTINEFGKRSAINMSFCILILLWPFSLLLMLKGSLRKLPKRKK